MIPEEDFFGHQILLIILKALQKVSCCEEIYKSWIELRQAARVMCDHPRRLHEFEALTHWEDRKRKLLVVRVERNSNRSSVDCHTRRGEGKLDWAERFELFERGSEVVRVSYQLLIDEFHSSAVRFLLHAGRVSGFHLGIDKGISNGPNTRLRGHQPQYWPWHPYPQKLSHFPMCGQRHVQTIGTREKIISYKRIFHSTGAQHFPSNLYPYPDHNHQQRPMLTHAHP